MARPRSQQGSVVLQSGKWLLKYREYGADGTPTNRTKTLCDGAHFRTEKDVREEFEATISSLVSAQNNVTHSDGFITLGEFIEKRYFPNLDARLKIDAGDERHIEPSTIKGYKDIFQKHVKPQTIVTSIPVRKFTPNDGQRFLDGLPSHLSHSTHLRIKAFLSGVFTYALTLDGVMSGGWNPMDPTKAYGLRKNIEGVNQRKLTEREKKIKASNQHAYTLEEVAEMLDKLPEPARTVCATAAFTGLTHSELPVLKWSDLDGETLTVKRKLWKTHIGAPKTLERSKPVYVIQPLQKMLVAYKKEFQPPKDDWIFYGLKHRRPLSLDNLSRRDIPQFINGAWFGWHAFRRGLGSRLNELGVPDAIVQSILRHSQVSTTQAYYIKPTAESAKRGLQRLAKVAATKYKIKL